MPSPRSLYTAGIVCLGLALVLGLVTSISLPTFSGIDFVRVNFPNSLANFMSQLRFGIWAPCFTTGDGNHSCVVGGHGYAFVISTFDLKKSVVIGSSWTRGLAIHPVATVFTAIALGFACLKHEHGPLLATLTSFVAAFLFLLAFIVDIALFAFVKQQVDTLHNGNTVPGPAFWLTFVSLILVLLSGCTVCFGRRKDSGASDYPSFSAPTGGILSRFRKS
ncbi:pali-domain-containing protein [Mycena albidolilacea]|uniref:Pali-domain-containing protein n=1 Tax=Mycena albidolilacea TaxID=1033008 RepID=A0AAD7A159_9AGAR|nr:pali-domain-containing protein [Mycena albidolilacea]